MALRDELLAETGPNTHIADLCGRAADELLIKDVKIVQQAREIERLRNLLNNTSARNRTLARKARRVNSKEPE